MIRKLLDKKNPKAITVLKKEGGGVVRQGMIMITDSMFFCFFVMATLMRMMVFCRNYIIHHLTEYFTIDNIAAIPISVSFYPTIFAIAG